IGEASHRQLVPPRALSALSGFRDLIEDARAILAGTYVERLEQATPVAKESLAPAAIKMGDAEDLTAFDPLALDFGDGQLDAPEPPAGENSAREAAPADFPLPTASTVEVLKWLIERTGYIRQLEREDTPEAYSRIENLHELVNAAMDSKDRGESLDQFLDHAALVSDADAYDEHAQITLMTLHAAKGLEFPLVFLCGLEEGLFPHSRTLLRPDDIEEERRLCYVGMTRAMDTLVLSRALYRRRYGTDLPERSVPSRFLEEIPPGLCEELGRSRRGHWGGGAGQAETGEVVDSHYAYEDEDQSASWPSRKSGGSAYSPKTYNSIDNIAEFFASRGKRFQRPKLPLPEATGKRGFRPGQRVRHPKYGEGTVYRREGEGEESKITVQFPRFGLKKLVEKYAQLERV
ncbi:MAG: ATP-binding domain-containing protein, partial [Acidobacteria bacterium]|nr:ATP-binding domain-containing protein [Acidobacteriota bacterium]